MYQTNLFDELIIDNFAGGGGASVGIELAVGRPVNIAINHNPDAIAMHAGKTLGAIYKTDKAVFDALANNPPSIEIAKACTIIREWVASK